MNTKLQSTWAITLEQAAEYEVLSSWWVGWLSMLLSTDVLHHYFVWKAKRKFSRYKRLRDDLPKSGICVHVALNPEPVSSILRTEKGRRILQEIISAQPRRNA